MYICLSDVVGKGLDFIMYVMSGILKISQKFISLYQIRLMKINMYLTYQKLMNLYTCNYNVKCTLFYLGF